jgi:hypothetical protein
MCVSLVGSHSPACCTPSPQVSICVPVEAPPAPPEPLLLLLVVPQSQAFKLRPSLAQVCVPIVPPGQAQAVCAPGVQPSLPEVDASEVPEEPHAARPTTTEPRRAALTQPNIDLFIRTPEGTWDAKLPTLSKWGTSSAAASIANRGTLQRKRAPPCGAMGVAVEDRTIDAIYTSINNGVCRAGFAVSQGAYEGAVTELFDPVYQGHFKCSVQRIQDYPDLWGFVRDVHRIQGVAATCRLDHIKEHYYRGHPSVDPTRIVPVGPRIDYATPHGRDVLFEAVPIAA